MANSLVGNTGLRPPTPKVKGYNVGQVQNFGPRQMELFKDLFGHVGPESYTGQLAAGDPGAFEQMERPALQQFNELQGNLASRFSGMGTGGRHSSGFQNTMNQSQQDFAGQLQSRRMDLQRQALQDLFSMSNDLLNQRPYENTYQKKEPKQSFWDKLIGGAAGIAPLAGGALGGLYGGMPGAKLGFKAGSAFSNNFFGGQ